MPVVYSLRSRHRLRALVATLTVGIALSVPAPDVLAQCQTNQSCYPPPGGCAYPAPGPIFYPGSPGPHGIRNGFLYDPDACAPLPPQGGSSVDSFFDIFVEIDLSPDGGATWVPRSLSPQPGAVRINPPVPQGPDLVFDTELVALDLVGIDFKLRESPTLPSPGRITRTDLGGGQYRIDSFFDVFTELSLDGGQTWFPSNQQLHITTVTHEPTPARASTWGAVKILYR